MLTDFRHALRLLLKARGFTAVVVAVLALGIGANAAIFSIVYGVVLKPLPFSDPSRLVALQGMVRGEPDAIAYLDLLDWAAASNTMTGMAGFAENGSTLNGPGEVDALPVAAVTGGFFDVLGVPPLRGRWLTRADDGKNVARTVVISEALWEKHFQRKESVIGSLATFDGQPATIVGVMSASFEFPFESEAVQAWFPMHALSLTATFADQRGSEFLHGVARLAPGATLAQANAELAAISARLAAEYPQTNRVRSATVLPLQQDLVHEYRLGLLVLLGAVGIVLLIASVNVANLLLVRATGRQREMAIRMALGAGRARLVRQLLTESALLAAAGGAAGLLLAVWGERALVAATPIDIPRLHQVHLNGAVLLFVLGASVGATLLFGLLPALHASRGEASDALNDQGRGSTGAHGVRTRQVLVVCEIALSLVLLAGAGLLVRTLLHLQQVDPGFVPQRAAAIEFLLPGARYGTNELRLGFYRRLIDALHGMPGVSASGVATTLPLSGSNIELGVNVPGQPDDPAHQPSVPYFGVSPGYFGAMGIPLVRGRQFTARDDERAPAVAIVSEALARRLWPGEDPVGKRLALSYNDKAPRDVVGVVGDVKRGSLEEASTGAVYAPFAQTPWPFMSAVIRTAGDPAAAMTSLRRVIPALDPSMAAPEVKRLTVYTQRATATPKFTAALVGSFALLALLLAAIGLYGVIAWTVVQRRREIGIRMALGAQPGDVRRLVLGQAARVGAIGLAIGLVGALAATRVLQSLLFGVGANDPATFAAACALLASIVALAALLPARRATRVDPAAALRAD